MNMAQLFETAAKKLAREKDLNTLQGDGVTEIDEERRAWTEEQARRLMEEARKKREGETTV